MAAKPPRIDTKPNLTPASPRSRALTFGSTSDKATAQRAFTIPTTSNNDEDNKNDGSSPDDNGTPPTGLGTTLSNLAVYLDWRNAKFSKDDINAELWKIALTVWDFLPASEPLHYNLSFSEAKKHTISKAQRPPVRITTSITGDILYCFDSSKQYIDYTDKCTIIVFMPYIDSISMVGVSFWETITKNDRCKWWEIEHATVTHIGFDKDDHIYFTNGESVYRIMALGEGDYRMTHEEIWAVDGDTSHITSLWRQGDQLYFTSQNWEKEERLDLYKIKYPKGGNSSTRSIASPTSPSMQNRFNARTRASTGRPSSAKDHKRYRSGSFGDKGGSQSGRSTPRSPSNDNDISVSKVRTFSLEFNQRVWQLTWLRYEKKFLLGIAACRGGSQPQLMQISFKKQLKLVPLGSKSYIWPKPYDDTIPHDFIYHRPTRTWLLFLPVLSSKLGKDPSKNLDRYWIQFRLDASKKKVVWHRLVPLPAHLIEGEWCHYDEIRDVLIGWQETNEKEQYYKLKFLPDVSKLLWVEMKDDAINNKENGGGDIDTPSMTQETRSADIEASINTKGGGGGKASSTKYKKNNKKGMTKSARKGARRPAKSAAMPATVIPKNKKDKNNKNRKQKGYSNKSGKNLSKTDKRGGGSKTGGTVKVQATTQSKTAKKNTIVENDMD